MTVYIQNKDGYILGNNRQWLDRNSHNKKEFLDFCIDETADIEIQNDTTSFYKDTRIVYENEFELLWGNSWHEKQGHIIREDPIYGGYTTRKIGYDREHREMKNGYR